MVPEHASPITPRDQFLKDFGANNAFAANWNTWRQGIQPEGLPSLRGCDFRGLHLAQINFTSVDLTDCKFGGVNSVDPTNLQGAQFIAATLVGATFDGADLSMARFDEAKAGNTSGIQDEYLRRISVGVHASSMSLRNGASFRNCNLTSARFTRAQLAGVNFRHCVLDRANFNGAELMHAEFEHVNVNSRTTFEGVQAQGMAIDKLTLESLGPDYGGITAGQRADMRIEDGVAKLRSSFSGFWQWIHALALAAFIAPYALFLVKHSVRAHFRNDDTAPTVSLLVALAQYIVSGGTAELGVWVWSWTALLFAFGMIYNVLRAVLLVKTKQLELHQEISGVPARFTLKRSAWGGLARTAAILFWVNLLVVLLHTAHFLQQRIPVDPIATPRLDVPSTLPLGGGDGR